jgi:hypothetical protein
MMRSVFYKIPIVLWATAWMFFTNVFVPLHTRGIIPLSPRTPAVQTQSCCCGEAEKGSNASSSTVLPDKKKGTPTGGSRPLTGNCAVCFLIAHLSMPVPLMDFTGTPERSGRTDILPSANLKTLFIAPAYYGRAPPSFKI